MDSDELLRQILEDELADQAELGKMSPREYAKLKGIAPQLVYYWARAGHVKVENCICGRKVIDVASADAYLSERAANKDQAAIARAVERG